MAQIPNLKPVPPDLDPRLTGKRGGKRLALLAGLLLILAAGMGVGGYLFFSSPPTVALPPEGEETETEGEAPEVPASPVVAVTTLAPLVVNLADTGYNRYLRVVLGIGWSDKKMTQRYDGDPILQSQVRDAVLSVLSAKTSEQILPAAGKEQLKVELRDTINTAIGQPLAQQVFFTEFLVQMM